MIIRTLSKAVAALVLAAALSPQTISAQQVQSRHAVPGHRYLKEYWSQPDLYLEHQAWYMLDLADKALNENPPATKISLEREMALLLVDAVTHEPKPIENPAVKDFIAKRMNHVLEDLDKPMKGRKSLKIYKLYNCGILFRTRDLTVAVDINGREGTLIPDEIMEKIVDHVDILFLTHNHGDHIDSHVRDFCHKRNIPIYAPDEIFKNDIRVNHVWKEGLYSFDITLPKGKLGVNVLPGHQDALQNNIWVVTMPNGKVVAATGDQYDGEKKDLAMLKNIHEKLPRIDVLSMDCWIHDLDEHLADFNPRLLVSQHENEIGAHGIDHRESFWMTMYKNRNFNTATASIPWVLMAWGEWYDYK